MKIRKAFQGTIPSNKIMDGFSYSKTDTYSCDYVNNALNYDMLRARLSSEPSMPPSVYTVIPFDDKFEVINSRASFDLNKGAVTVTGDYVKKVRVYVSAFDSSWASNSLYLTININGNIVKRTYMRTTCNICLEGEFSVKKGDVITTTFYTSSSSALKLSTDSAYCQLIVSAG